MTPNQLAAFKNLEQAQQALKAGDKVTARQLVAQAAQLAPELEEVWLLMAALASPRGSVAYLERALQINPNSERAQKGMLWAQGRLKQEQDSRSSVVAQLPSEQPTEQPAKVERPVPVVPVVTAPAAPDVADTQPTPVLHHEEPTPEPVSTPDVILTVDGKDAVARPRYLSMALLVILVCIVIGWASSVTPVKAFFSKAFAGQEHGPAWAQVDIVKSDATQSAAAPTALPVVITSEPTEALDQIVPTPTLEILASETPLPTEIVVPTSELIAAPTETSIPTETSPAPTGTPMPTDVVPAATVSGSGPAEQPSPTPLPTDTAAPGPTQFVPATPNPNAGSASQGTGHWIDVDLTHQMVYAYDGNTVVNSFLVSTGTWQYPTVTGQYHVYIKLRYKDMSGPGYYLPNVPYTMFFYQGYALHGTYWHSNFGTPMSHGCVNLSIPDSEWVYNFSSVGTLVNVHY